jgi:integrase
MPDQQINLFPTDTGRHLSDSSRRTYELCWTVFKRFCDAEEAGAARPRRETTDPRALVAFIDDRIAMGKRASSIRKDVHGISLNLVAAGFPDPRDNDEVKAALKRVMLQAESALSPQPAILNAGIRATLQIIREPKKGRCEELRALRDASILLLLFAGALRRDEARRLRFENAVITQSTLDVLVSSADDREPRLVHIPRGKNPTFCPVAAYKAWIDAAPISDGYVYRAISPDGVVGVAPIDPAHFTILFNERLRKAGIRGRVSTHVFRRGFIAQSVLDSMPVEEILAYTDHVEPVHVRPLINKVQAMRGHVDGNTLYL